MTRALGIPAALALFVALPGFIPQPAKEEGPPPREAKLTVNLEGNEGAAGHPYRFAVTASGPTPARATLRDASGLSSARVKPAAACGAPTRIGFPDEEGSWCLALTDVPVGHELSGVVSGAGGKDRPAHNLQLIVNRRDAFIGLPAVILAVGLLVGILIIVFKSALRKVVRQTVLNRLLHENEAAGADRIDELSTFAKDHLAAGEALDDVIAKVAEMQQLGLARARSERMKLAEALKKDSGKLRASALVTVARKEADRTSNAVADFYGSDGEKKAHPATVLLVAVEELVEDVGIATKLRAALRRLPRGEKQAPDAALARAESVAREANTPEDVKRVRKLLSETRDAIEKAQAKRRGPHAPAGEGTAALAQVPLASDGPPAPPQGKTSLGKQSFKAVALTVLAVAAVLAFALITIKESAYDPRLTFSSFDDYFTLFAAAVGSAAAGSVVLLLGFWSPVPDPTAS